MRELVPWESMSLQAASDEEEERTVSALGIHLLADAWGCCPERLNDSEGIRQLLESAAAAIGANLIEICIHRFSPHGVTGVATLAESHITIHTWPESSYCAMDLFLCGNMNPQPAVQLAADKLEAQTVKVIEIRRGIPPSDA